jgi:hypothetical protein
MAGRETVRLVELLQSARPMRLFRGCRYLSRGTVDEICALTESPGDDATAAVGAAIRNAKKAPLTDGLRLRSEEIDSLLSRLGA